MKQFAAATADTMAKEQKKSSGGFGGLASMFSGIFGGGSQSHSSPPPPPEIYQNAPPPEYSQQKSGIRMKGPTNIDEIINNDRIETMSSASESEIFSLQDDASINGIINSSKRGKKKKTLDI
jgi:hypothetical protein